MAIVSGLPFQQSSPLNLRPSYDFSRLTLPRLTRPEDSCRLESDPVSARGVTRMQAQAANHMTGESDPQALDEAGGTVAGAVSDGLGEVTGRGARAGRAADLPGRVAGTLRGVGRVAGPVATALELFSGGKKINAALRDDSLTDSQRDAMVGGAVFETAGTVAGGAAGAAAGAALGTKLGMAIGTCFCPLLGTLVGGAVGCAVGAVAGGFLGGEVGERLGAAIGRTSVGSAVGDFVNDRFGR